MKRAIDARIVVETESSTDEIRDALLTAAHALSKACEGRLVVTAAEIAEEDAQKVWSAAGLAVKADPDAKTWTPRGGKWRGT